MSQKAFLQDVDLTLAAYEQAIGVVATRTRQMIERYGAIDVFSRLAISADLQSGFKALRDRNQLDLTAEAVIVRHAGSFREDVVAAANWRLENAHLLK